MNKAVCIGVSVALVLDAAWFIRFAITKIVATFFRSDLKSILDESVVYSICSTKDLDVRVPGRKWRGWIPAKEKFEKDLINDFC